MMFCGGKSSLVLVSAIRDSSLLWRLLLCLLLRVFSCGNKGKNTKDRLVWKMHIWDCTVCLTGNLIPSRIVKVLNLLEQTYNYPRGDGWERWYKGNKICFWPIFTTAFYISSARSDWSCVPSFVATTIENISKWSSQRFPANIYASNCPTIQPIYKCI